MIQKSRIVFGLGLVLVLAAAATVFVSRAAEPDDKAVSSAIAIPIDGPYRYRVDYLGVKCGELSLESRLENYEGRPAYHIIMTGRNAKFFNSIYKVDGRVDSWVDAESLTTVAYRSDVTEKGERKIVSYRVDLETNEVLVDKEGEKSTFAFEGRPALDPVAFIFRARLLANDDGEAFNLALMTDEGPIEARCDSGKTKRFRTYSGNRTLRRVQPKPVDEEKYGRKGEFLLWVGPAPSRTLYRLDFKLGFGRLLAKLVGEAEGSVDRREAATTP